MENSRTKKGIRNVAVTVFLYLLYTIFEFLNRSTFLFYLNTEYQGLNSLFKNIVGFLSLSELGIGTAISFALYKPLSENNQLLIWQIMNLYKKLYRLIGIIVLFLGGLVTPFLTLLMKEEPTDISHLWLYYLLYVINAGVSYFYSYKRTIIICDQKQYISSITTMGSKIILSVIQIFILAFTKSYFLYLASMLFITLAENILISIIADRQYPYLKNKKDTTLPKEVSQSIKNNVYAMFFHKIGSVVISSTDNIVISRVVGLTAVGLYSNYVLVTNALTQIMNQAFSALTASVGNLEATASDEYKETVFNRIFFLDFVLSSFSAISLLCLFQTFISLWLGREYLLDDTTVIIIVLNFYIQSMRSAVLLFRNAFGVFWNDRYKPVFESIVNIAFSIPLAFYMGVKGVLLGTIISTLTVSLWVEGYILYKYGFHKSVKSYFFNQIKCFLLFLCCAGITYLFVGILSFNGIVKLIASLLICLLLPNTIAVFVFRNREEFQYYRKLLHGLRLRFMEKIKG